MPTSTVTVKVADTKAGKSGTASLAYAYGVAGLVGATVQNTDYPGCTWLTAAQTYNTYTGTSMGTTMGKRYFAPGQWWPSIPTSVSQLDGTGMRYLLCPKPGGATAALEASEQQNLAALITMLQKAGVSFDVALWNEANLAAQNPPFTSPAVYQAYVAYYYPVLAEYGVNHIYIPGAYNVATAVSFYPGDQYVQAVAPDFYAVDYVRTKAVLDRIEALADNHSSGPVPLGLGEWGVGPSNPVMTTAQVQTYTGYLGRFFWGRLLAGKANYPLLYFNPDEDGDLITNTVTSATDPKAPLIQSVFNGVSLQALGS